MSHRPRPKVEYQAQRRVPAPRAEEPRPLRAWAVAAGLVGALIVMVIGIWLGWRGGDRNFGLVVIRDVSVRLLGWSAAIWGYIGFVWLCCVAARARGYSTAWGLLGLTILGALVIPFLIPEPAGALERKPAPKPTGARHVFALFATWLLVVLAFWNSFDSQWVLDNLYIIRYDPRTRSQTWDDPKDDFTLRNPGVKNYFTQDYWWPKGISGLYRPLTGLTYWVNWTVLAKAGDDEHRFRDAQVVRGFHAVNMVLHWLNAALVYVLVFVLTRRWGVAMIAAGIFAVHPITTESVTNIIGRADLFAALAVLSGLLVWRWGASLAGWYKLFGFVLVLVITAFGVFSKESAIAIGLVLLIYDIAYRWNPVLARWFGAILLVALAPAVSGPSFAISKAATELPLWIRIGAVLLAAGAAGGLHLWARRLPDRHRLFALGGCVLIAVAASAFVPAAGVGIVGLLIAIEYFIGPWFERSFADFDRIKLPAALYTAAFVAVVFTPLVIGRAMWRESGAASQHSTPMHSLVGPMNVLLGTLPDADARMAIPWQDQYFRAGMVVAFGLLVWLSFTTHRRGVRRLWLGLLGILPLYAAWWLRDKYDYPTSASRREYELLLTIGRLTLIAVVAAIFARGRAPAERPWPALVVVFIGSIVACFFVFWAGFVLSFVVGLLELVRSSCAPGPLRRSVLWQGIVQRFVVGYYLLLPPVIAMFFVRYWIFNIQSTPPETPFLDNPLRGGPFDPLPFWQSRLTAIKVMGKLMYLLFWPVNLSSDYSWDEIPFFTWRLWQWENIKTLIALSAIIGLIVVACRNFIRNKALFFFIMFFFAAILPTSNLPTLIGSIMAERFLYLPLIGFSGAIAIVSTSGYKWLMTRIRAGLDSDNAPAGASWLRVTVPVAAACMVLTLLAARAYVRNFDWYKDETLWAAAGKVSPRSFRCYQSMAFALYEVNPRFYVDRMIETAEKARPIVDPLSDDRNSSRLYLHLGMYYNIKGEMLMTRDERGALVVTPEARPWFAKAAEVLERGSRVDRNFNQVNRRRQLERGDKPEKIYDAGLTPIYQTLGLSYARLGRYSEAYNAFNYQRQLEPENSDPYVRIALLFIEQGRYEEAAVSLIQALLLDWKREDAWNALAQIYAGAGDNGRTAISISPQGPRLNVDNLMVRDHFIQAYRGFIRIFRFANRPGAAETARRTAIFRYRMPAPLFDSVMVEPIMQVTPQGLLPFAASAAVR